MFGFLNGGFEFADDIRRQFFLVREFVSVVKGFMLNHPALDDRQKSILGSDRHHSRG